MQTDSSQPGEFIISNSLFEHAEFHGMPVEWYLPKRKKLVDTLPQVQSDHFSNFVKSSLPAGADTSMLAQIAKSAVNDHTTLLFTNGHAAQIRNDTPHRFEVHFRDNEVDPKNLKILMDLAEKNGLPLSPDKIVVQGTPEFQENMRKAWAEEYARRHAAAGPAQASAPGTSPVTPTGGSVTLGAAPPSPAPTSAPTPVQGTPISGAPVSGTPAPGAGTPATAAPAPGSPAAATPAPAALAPVALSAPLNDNVKAQPQPQSGQAVVPPLQTYSEAEMAALDKAGPYGLGAAAARPADNRAQVTSQPAAALEAPLPTAEPVSAAERVQFPGEAVRPSRASVAIDGSAVSTGPAAIGQAAVSNAFFPNAAALSAPAAGNAASPLQAAGTAALPAPNDDFRLVQSSPSFHTARPSSPLPPPAVLVAPAPLSAASPATSPLPPPAVLVAPAPLTAPAARAAPAVPVPPVHSRAMEATPAGDGPLHDLQQRLAVHEIAIQADIRTKRAGIIEMASMELAKSSTGFRVNETEAQAAMNALNTARMDLGHVNTLSTLTNSGRLSEGQARDLMSGPNRVPTHAEVKAGAAVDWKQILKSVEGNAAANTNNSAQVLSQEGVYRGAPARGAQGAALGS